MSNEENSQELGLFAPQIRRVWHQGAWYYSITDVVAVLTAATNPQNYWSVLKRRLKNEGSDTTLQQIASLKLKSADNRFRLTDTANRQTLLRLIQTIPSPRVEPFKLWLAQVGEERLAEIEHPEAALDRVRAAYRAKGYDHVWIEERIKNDLTRNELTDEWQDRGAEGPDYSILTNEITKGTFDLSVQAYKRYKVVPTKANLRDHMDILELALCSLSEATAITLHRDRDSQGFPELKRDASDAGRVGGNARQMLEKEIGRPVATPKNFLDEKKEKTKKARKQLPTQSGPSLFDEPTRS